MDYLFKNTTKWESTLINFLPEQIHIRYLKMVLGLHKSAVNIAVLSRGVTGVGCQGGGGGGARAKNFPVSGG